MLRQLIAWNKELGMIDANVGRSVEFGWFGVRVVPMPNKVNLPGSLPKVRKNAPTYYLL